MFGAGNGACRARDAGRRRLTNFYPEHAMKKKKHLKTDQPLNGAVTLPLDDRHTETAGQNDHHIGARMVPAYSLVVCIVSFLIYGFNYSYSSGLFWDENYHITSAQKYIDGVFFMGDHPPLGKEIIALGEVILHPNKKVDTSSFLTVEKADDVPKGYSFTGQRFMPSFLAVLSGVVFFYLLVALLDNAHLALLFSGFYLFENAFVVHSRGAMLDSIQLFFILLSLLCFAPMIRQRQGGVGRYFVLGMLLGASTAVKLNALLFMFLPLVLIILEVKRKDRTLRMLLQYCAASAAGFLLIFLGSYVAHIYLTPKVLQNRYYSASPAYKEILDKGETKQLRHLPLQIYEHLKFIPEYQKGVPQYDPSNPEENGSLPYTWPFMNKTINYRWEKNADGRVRYLYLTGNPVLWLVGAVAVLISTALVLSRFMLGIEIRNKRTFELIVIFTSLYWFYMAAMLRLARVMYLYHYFVPLISSYILAALLFSYGFERKIEVGNRKLYGALACSLVLVIGVFIFFSPLSYFQPLTFEQFQLRNWFECWKMQGIQ
jgi:dolichyl-phosphate-mannose-protein mannosyltransferase